MEALVMSNRESPLTNITPHEISGDWVENSVLFFRNPASGAIEVRPTHRDKVARSLSRHARKMKRRLLLLHLRLQIEYFALQGRCTALILARYFLRLAEKAIRYTHNYLPKKISTRAKK
jgi:hypothetical protein